MSIEEMEQTLLKRKKANEGRSTFYCNGVEEMFQYILDELKDHIDRIAELEKMLCECLGKDEICCCPKSKK